MIAQNGRITNFVTAVETAYWNHTPVLLVRTASGKTRPSVRGGFQEMEQMNLFKI
jgi:sulfoacetaldehyde acetyltransferase